MSLKSVNSRGKARRIALCLSLLVCAAVAFTARHPALADDTQARLDHLENEVQTLSRAVFKGEMPASPDVAEATPGGAAVAGQADMLVRMNNLEQEIQQLTNKVEQQGYDGQQLKQRLDKMEAENAQHEQAEAKAAANRPGPGAGDVDKDLNGSDATPAATAPPTSTIGPTGAAAAAATGSNVDTAATDAAATAAAAKAADTTAPASQGSGQLGKLEKTPSGDVQAVQGSAANDYEQAFTALRNHQYDDAEKEFTDFLSQHPDSNLAPNAQYWLGETYYARADYQSSAKAFALSYQKYPKGAKAPDSLLKLAQSLKQMGKKDDACLSLAQLQREYSLTGGAALAKGREEASSLGCKA